MADKLARVSALGVGLYGAFAPPEHLSAAELVRDLLLPKETHRGVASRLLGQPKWVWSDELRGRHALTSRGRRVMVQSRRGLLREAAVFVLAADLQGQPGVATLPEEALAAVTVLIESGAVTVGPEIRRSDASAAEYLSRETPFDYVTCLDVVRQHGPTAAVVVLNMAAGAGVDPWALGHLQVGYGADDLDLPAVPGFLSPKRSTRKIP